MGLSHIVSALKLVLLVAVTCHGIAFEGQRRYSPDGNGLDFVYHTHEDMTTFLRYVSVLSVEL